jgi:hypothetical protein
VNQILALCASQGADRKGGAMSKSLAMPRQDLYDLVWFPLFAPAVVDMGISRLPIF